MQRIPIHSSPGKILVWGGGGWYLWAVVGVCLLTMNLDKLAKFETQTAFAFA